MDAGTVLRKPERLTFEEAAAEGDELSDDFPRRGARTLDASEQARAGEGSRHCVGTRIARGWPRRATPPESNSLWKAGVAGREAEVGREPAWFHWRRLVAAALAPSFHWLNAL